MLNVDSRMRKHKFAETHVSSGRRIVAERYKYVTTEGGCPGWVVLSKIGTIAYSALGCSQMENDCSDVVPVEMWILQFI